eukprot:g7172.t1
MFGFRLRALVAAAGAGSSIFPNDRYNHAPSAYAFRFKSRFISAATSTSKAKKTQKCPPAAPCNCHCECPPPTSKPQPPPAKPCPFVPIIPGAAKPPAKYPAKCPTGQVKRSSGECSEITPEVIAELQHTVAEKLDLLVAARTDFKKTKTTISKREVFRKSLLMAHDAYETALDMLLGAWVQAPFRKQLNAEAAAAPKKPEFSVLKGGLELDVASLVPHCESWTALLKNFDVSVKDCAIMCRQQTNCVGFVFEENQNLCVWYTKSTGSAGTNGKNANANSKCLEHPTGSFQVKTNEVSTELARPITKDMSGLGRLQDIIESQMVDTDKDADTMSDPEEKRCEHFALWNQKSTPDALSTGALSIEDADRLMEGFVGAKLLYSQEVVDTKKVWVAMMKIAGRLADELREDAEIQDPLPKPKAKPAPPPATKPKPSWSEFANFGDTKWSQEHPDCPQGPPCVCDCACRGSPPQNFIDPPPPPPKPCPEVIPPPAGGLTPIR